MVEVTITVILGGIMIGESIALLVGTTILRNKFNGWLSRKNGAFLGSDMILAALIILALPALQYFPAYFFSLFLVVGIATHSYRTLEYYSQKDQKFCANFPLFVVNNIKLLAFLVLLGIALY